MGDLLCLASGMQGIVVVLHGRVRALPMYATDARFSFALRRYKLQPGPVHVVDAANLSLHESCVPF